MNQKAQEAVEKVGSCLAGRELFTVNCLKDESGEVPQEWMLSSLVPIFKGKRDSFNPNSYRGINLLGHVFKLYENVLDGRLCEVVDIDKM